MKKSGDKFLSVEMLCVRKEYQGKGYMRKAMEDVFRLADEKRLPVVLETDETLKADKYKHLGMEQEGVRRFTPQIAFYEMIYRPEDILLCIRSFLEALTPCYSITCFKDVFVCLSGYRFLSFEKMDWHI